MGGSPLLGASVTQGIRALFQDLYFSGITNSIHCGKRLHSFFSSLWAVPSSLAGLLTPSMLTAKDKHHYQPFLNTYFKIIRWLLFLLRNSYAIKSLASCLHVSFVQTNCTFKHMSLGKSSHQTFTPYELEHNHMSSAFWRPEVTELLLSVQHWALEKFAFLIIYQNPFKAFSLFDIQLF